MVVVAFLLLALSEQLVLRQSLLVNVDVLLFDFLRDSDPLSGVFKLLLRESVLEPLIGSLYDSVSVNPGPHLLQLLNRLHQLV